MSTIEKNALIGALAVVICLLAIPPGSLSGGCGCPPLWTGFGQHCYRYFTYQNITFFDAELQCNGFAVPCTEGATDMQLGHLTSVHSREEMNFLIAMYESVRDKKTSSSSRVWIGLHDMVTEDAFEWTDGSSLDYTYWASGQPNNYLDRDQDCVSFFAGSDRHAWNDLHCGGSFIQVESFICKLPMW